MSKLLYHGNGLNTTSGDADFVNYDNTDSGLSATNVQSALDEITEDKISILSLTTAEYEAKKSEYDAMNVLIRLTDSNRTLNASNISYDDSSTSLGASDVQTAIEAVNSKVDNIYASDTVDVASSVSVSAGVDTTLGTVNFPSTGTYVVTMILRVAEGIDSRIRMGYNLSSVVGMQDFKSLNYSGCVYRTTFNVTASSIAFHVYINTACTVNAYAQYVRIK